MSGKLVVLLVVLSYAHYSVFAKTSNVVCYFTNWTTYRSGSGQYKVSNIDVSLCTHIFYAFEGLTPEGTFKLLDEWGDINLHQIDDIIELKKLNKDLKILVSIGGYGSGSANFPTMAASSAYRANFISSTLAAIKKYGFDGLDLVWEYPGTHDKANFASLIQEARITFSANNLLLTAGVQAITSKADSGYDVPVLSKNLDMITIMSYDFHGYYDGYTGANAPLYSSPEDTTADAKLLNVNNTVRTWMSLGADPQKLIIGVAFYGKSYQLSNKGKNGIGAPVLGPGPIGPYTKQQGVLGFNEICELKNAGGWTRVFEDYQKVPYMYKDDMWISYDDEMSIKMKVEYAKQKKLLGLAVWSLGIDDFHGTCGKANALLSAINDDIEK